MKEKKKVKKLKKRNDWDKEKKCDRDKRIQKRIFLELQIAKIKPTEEATLKEAELMGWDNLELVTRSRSSPGQGKRLC